MKNPAVTSFKEERFIRLITGNQDRFDAIHVGDAESRGIRNVVEFLAAEFASRKFCSWREREELFRTDAAVFEFIDGNAIAGVTRLCAESVGEGGHGSVEAVSIKAERQAEEIGLVSVVTDAVFGEVGELIG